MIIDRATPATQNEHDKSIRYRPSHDSNLQQAQTFFLLKYIYYIICFFWVYETNQRICKLYVVTTLRFPMWPIASPRFSPARMGDKFEMRSSRDGSDEMITHCEAVGKSCPKDLRNVSWKGAGVKAIDWNWWNLFFRFLMTCFCWSFF